MKVGDKFWSFSANRRHYDENRKIIYREHYYRVEIIGETSRSWIIGNGRLEEFKVPKADPFRNKYGEFDSRPVIRTDQMVADECYANAHGSKIADIVRRLDGGKLREIAKLIGYKPEEMGSD